MMDELLATEATHQAAEALDRAAHQLKSAARNLRDEPVSLELRHAAARTHLLAGMDEVHNASAALSEALRS